MYLQTLLCLLRNRVFMFYNILLVYLKQKKYICNRYFI